ncbi:BTAD domain-containing putative transcriptional regulator [Nonomuraea sp. NPDC001831]|uniref:AfsR/SARP family transcriptional regulator n=1 Tax=Nonomuraea sp. NPDC001831 TaxID=3364340 RepID=UPI0036CAB36E
MKIGRPKLRLLLAILLTDPNAPVSVDRLVDELWQGEPPESALSNVRTYVWTLRRMLSSTIRKTAPISTDPLGYMIEVPSDGLDAVVFERLIAEGTAARLQGDLSLATERFKQALGLWQGPVFQDVPHLSDALAIAAQRLDEQRLMAVESLCDAQLAMGMQAEVTAELQSWVHRYPLRERLSEQLMLGLYRDGRQAEALSVFHRLRTHLIEEIGVEPSLPLQILQGRILQSDPQLSLPGHGAMTVAAPPIFTTPQQLPLDIETFVGRHDDLEMLGGLLRTGDPARSGAVVVIHGPPGVGKSALAIRSAYRWSAYFPDGQLYVDLRGTTSDNEPLCPGEALGRFLRALGVPAKGVPQDIEEAAALFRTLIARRRMLIILDNIATERQARALLPGSSRNVVLMTSRARLAALNGTTDLELGPLDPDAAQTMLQHLVGSPRVVSDPLGAVELAQLCEYLPLALYAAAYRLKARPGWTVRCLVNRLADERYRLDELAVSDVRVRESLEVSHSALRRSEHPDDRVAARALCLIGLAPVLELDVGRVADLLDITSVEADRIVQRLLDVHLLETVGHDRYRMSGLIRLVARELATDALMHDQGITALSGAPAYD